jgi:hypothetical protein
VHISTTGTVTVWHRTGDGYRLTEVQPDGRVRAGEGATMDATREDWRHPPADPIEAARAALQAALDEIDAEVTKADELLKTAGERKTLLVEQEPAALV